MKIRQLKKGTASAWPPAWGSAYKEADVFPRGEEGDLAEVKRCGARLMLTMTWKNKTYGPEELAWDEPPTVAQVERVLKANQGKPIQSIGDLEVEACSAH